MLDPQEVKDALRQFIGQEILKRPDYPLQDDESLSASGLLDSFALVEIGIFVDEQFDVYIPNEAIDLNKMDTISGIAETVLEWEGKENGYF